jgi:hypothetical protein
MNEQTTSVKFVKLLEISETPDIGILIKNQTHPEDIAQILGTHPVALRRILPKNYQGGPRLTIPYGMTNQSAPFRAFLADILITMGERGLSRQQISKITGLNKHESCRAERRPFSHDWTISQIERTLKWKETCDITRRSC